MRTKLKLLGYLLVFTLCFSLVAQMGGMNAFAENAPTEEGRKYIQEAFNFYEQKNLEDAIKSCDKAITAEPGNADFYLTKAAFLKELKNNQDAIGCYDAVLKINPAHAEAFLSKARMLQELGKNDEAIQCMNEAIEKNPDLVTLYVAKSYMMFEQGRDSKEVVDCLVKIIEVNPQQEEAHYNLACTYAKMNKKDEALKSLKRAIQLNPRYKVSAAKDKDFDSIRSDKEFEKLLSISVNIDGRNLEFDVLPTIKLGRTLLPLRIVFENLGGTVEWDSKTKTITGKKGNTTIILKIGEKVAKVNGQDKELDASPEIIESRTLIPLRFVSEAFGAQVEWNKDYKIADIISEDTSLKQLSTEEANATYSQLDSSVDKIFIDGIRSEPYGLDATEGKLMVVAKTQETLKIFQSLPNPNKIEYLNNKMQGNWGELLGCKVVHVSFVFDKKEYCYMDTSYEAADKDLTIKNYKLGIETNVVVQDKSVNMYRYYYKKQ